MMHHATRNVRLATAGLALLLSAVPGSGVRAQSDSSWRIVPEGAPARAAVGEFAPMAPGWHATAKAAGLVYDPAIVWSGDDSLQAVIYLFSDEPGTGAGLILAGHDLGTPAAHYLSFEVGPDGRYRITRRSNGVTTELIPWRATDALPRHPGGQANVRVVLDVHSTGADMQFGVNGTLVATLPKIAVGQPGAVGFRIERGTSAHIATFLIGGRNVAPAPARTS
jgi:hypothetical protein